MPRLWRQARWCSPTPQDPSCQQQQQVSQNVQLYVTVTILSLTCDSNTAVVVKSPTLRLPFPPSHPTLPVTHSPVSQYSRRLLHMRLSKLTAACC